MFISLLEDGTGVEPAMSVFHEPYTGRQGHLGHLVVSVRTLLRLLN